ncbi:hypothetical protein ADICYQ_5580 [Cyclobacterium qasimii M12-11B]|nr:hypothetical protein ADICYQ_5580 [Cyclobacterium qasimii M12-11B]
MTSLLFTNCVEDEPESDIKTIELGATLTASMGSDLSTQVYVNLSEALITDVPVNTWELAFENNGEAIRTNSAKKVAVTVPSEGSFDEVTSDQGLVYVYDAEDGDLSKTALAGWELNVPYILDLGIDQNGNTLGKKKLMITAHSSTGISIQYANLDGSGLITDTVVFDGGDFTFYSLISEQTVTVEPANWDFVLTGVSLRTGAPCAALGPGAVPGINCDVYRLSTTAMINHYNGVELAVDDPFADLEQNDDPTSEKNLKTIEDSNYELLTLNDYYSLGSSDAGDAIGRSWLNILTPHSSAIYKVYDFITYLVKDQDGNYYKVRFLAYKGGDNAENGNPTFEYARLEE